MNRNDETFGQEYVTVEVNVFVSKMVDEITLFLQVSPFSIWLTKKAFGIEGLKIVDFTPFYCKPLVTSICLKSASMLIMTV